MKYIDKEYVEEIINKYNCGKKISRRKNIFYRNMEYTLNNSVYYVLNDEEKIEWAKCYSDVEYFIEKYLNIKLRKYQKNWIKLYLNNNECIYNVARQTGINTILSAITLHSMIFHHKNNLLIPCIDQSGKNFLNMMRTYYFRLPYFLKPSIKYTNNVSLEFTNCKFNLYNKTININDYDIIKYHDYAFIPNPPDIDNIDKSKIIITSTPNGKNHFYNLVKNSLLPEDHPDYNGFKTIKTYWYEVEGRDENWRQEQIKMLGIDKFNQEYNLEF